MLSDTLPDIVPPSASSPNLSVSTLTPTTSFTPSASELLCPRASAFYTQDHPRWSAHSGLLLNNLEPPPALRPRVARCSSEPPPHQSDIATMATRVQRSRSISRATTPRSPATATTVETLEPIPVAPKVVHRSATYLSSDALASAVMATESALASPGYVSSQFPLPSPTSVTGATASLPLDSNMINSPPQPRSPIRGGSGNDSSSSTPSTPAQQSSTLLGRSPLDQYTNLFLLEPHEYDAITDGELIQLYDIGVIDGRILEQIVNATIRIQRSCTDADRAVSIKTRRAMIRHALED